MRLAKSKGCVRWSGIRTYCLNPPVTMQPQKKYQIHFSFHCSQRSFSIWQCL